MVAEFGGNNIKCSKYATFGTEKLSKYVNEVLHKRKGCLIANHGQVTIGCNLCLLYTSPSPRDTA